jgi:hypothetical protein
LFVRSSDRSIVRPIIHGSFARSSDRSIVRPFVRPNNLFPVVMPPKFRSFIRSFMVRSSVRPIVRSFVRSFVQIIFFLPLCCRNSDRPLVRSFDRSSFVHSSYSSFIVRSSSLFTITIYRHYLPSLFTVTIYRYYSPLLFIDHPITPNFNYSSIMLSSPPKTSQTHIPVIQTPVTVIFLPEGTSHLVTHPRFLQVEHA